MSWVKKIESARSPFTAIAVLAVAITGMWFGAQFYTVDASGNSNDVSPPLTFPGTNTGAIPDGTAGCTGNTAGPSRDVMFNVTGVTGTITDVSVTMDITHSWVGDLGAYLIAPNATSHILFERTGRSTATSCGKPSNLAGSYTFTDSASGTNWWAAASTTTSAVTPPGSYRSTAPGPQPTANDSPVTSITSAFSGVTNPNGTWTLRVNDYGGIDTGSVNSASLSITAGGGTGGGAQFLDFFGNNLTDFGILTFPTGPAGGQVRWRVAKNDNPTTNGSAIIDQAWGQSNTDAVPNFGNYIGDARTDFNLYRINSGSPANTYLINQNDDAPGEVTAFVNWGNSTTDLIGKEGDYNGDGIMDPTVVRSPTGAANFTWYILNSGSNTLTSFVYGVPSTDIALPGADYTGDGTADPAVIRIGAGGQVNWIVGTTGGAVLSFTPWGDFDTDFVIPGGDYDGDNKADFMVWRGFGAGTNGVWYLKTSTGAESAVPYGIPGLTADRDIALRGGDYDGDGKDDIAVYRPSTSSFIVRRSSNMGTVVQNWGVPGNTNIPMASFGTF